MMKYVVFLLGIFSFFLLPAVSQADTIHLKNGFSIEGTIKYQDEEKIILATKDGEVEFYFREIKSIESKKKTFPFLKKPIVTLYLKNGAILSGSLVREDDNEVLIWWHGGEVSFLRSEIERLEYGKRIEKEKKFLFPVVKEEKWPYRNDVAIQLTNLEILDFPISEVYKDKVVLREELEGGGFIEQEIPRSKIERLYFKPVENERSQRIKSNLGNLFPYMKFYQEGQFTIVTDSHPVWIREYKKAIRQHISEFYLTFFDLLKDRRPKCRILLLFLMNGKIL